MEEVKNVQEVEEVTSETNETEKMSVSDYKIIIDMIKEVEEQYNSLKETLSAMVQHTYGVKPEILDMILPYNKDDIPTMDSEVIRDFLNKYIVDENDTRYTEMLGEGLIDAMTEIKDASLVLLSTKKEADEIKESSADVLKEYFNYMSSDRVKKSREKRLEAMKKALELETNELEKKKIQKMISMIESTLNFSFVKSRFDEFGAKELESIRHGYFTMKAGSYIIDRFKSRIPKFGYNTDIYKYFFNIEENFLPKKYSPFNNLFLFIYMRMVAYADPYDKNDKMMVQALTGALANLIYHKFDSLEGEQFFIQVITDVLDLFINEESFDYVEYFKENNTTYEEHPARKEAEAMHETRRKESLLRMLANMNITGFDSSMTADELQEIYNRETDLMIKNQVSSTCEESELTIENSEDVDVNEEESDVTTITPKFEKNSVYGVMGNPSTDEETSNEE